MATAAVMRTYTTEEAACVLRAYGLSIGTETLKAGIRQGSFPFGNYVEMDKGVYFIYAAQFDRWIADRCIQEEIPEVPEYLYGQEQ